MRERPRAILFDLDQTLLQHSDPMLAHARSALAERYPDIQARQFEAFERMVTSEAEAFWNSVSQWAGRGEELLTQAFAKALESAGLAGSLAGALLQQLMRLAVESIKPTPGALATLAGLAAVGVKLGIVTNGFTAFQHLKARHHGLLEYMQLVTSEDAGAHKPDPRIFELAMKHLEVEPAHVWHVGDSVGKDMRGAANAGIAGILFDPGRQYEPQAHPGFPSHVVSDLRELLQLVDTGS